MKSINGDVNGRISFLTYMSDRGGVGHIRTILPSLVLGSWRYKKIQFDPIFLSDFIPDPNFYKTKTFVKFQRSATKEQLNMFRWFKQNVKTPFIYEVDDLLFNIPKTNFASDYYEKNKNYIEEMLSICNGITVSTGMLKKIYSKYNKNISVVRNRLSKALWGDIKPYEYNSSYRKLRILYPGSQNHFSIDKEGGDIGNSLIKYIKDTKKDKFEWIFMGGIPYELRNDKDITYIKWVDYINYPGFMKNFYTDLAIAPLEINEFNSCKSNLKMLEYVVCGFPAVYTDIEPYKNATITCKTEENMIEQIEILSKDPDLRYKIWEKDKNIIKDHLFLEENRKSWINEHLKLFNTELK